MTDDIEYVRCLSTVHTAYRYRCVCLFIANRPGGQMSVSQGLRLLEQPAVPGAANPQDRHRERQGRRQGLSQGRHPGCAG